MYPTRATHERWFVLTLAGAALATVGLMGLQPAATLVVVGLQAVFLVYFFRHMLFAVAGMSNVQRDQSGAVVLPSTLPSVSVLVACRNEETVVAGLVASLAALDYPASLLEAIVVDDRSTDATGALLDQLTIQYPLLRVVHRGPGARVGKSAALNEALAHAGGDIVVVFDADHTPDRDVLRRLVRHFSDPAVAAVQGRCVVRNGQDSLIARMVAVDYSAGYLVNEYGRQYLFQLPAYGGANCAVRSDVLRAMGGWNPDSVTEDTDLTMRLLLAGEVLRFDVTAIDREEAVVSLRRYWRQRYRWARGHQQVCRDYRSAVLRSPHLTRLQKLESILFLYVFHVPVATMGALIVGLLSLTGTVHTVDPLQLYVLWTLLSVGPLFELGAGLVLGGHPRRDAPLLALFLPLFFVSATLCTLAWIDNTVGRRYTWVKTARRGQGDAASNTRHAARHVRSTRGPVAVAASSPRGTR